MSTVYNTQVLCDHYIDNVRCRIYLMAIQEKNSYCHLISLQLSWLVFLIVAMLSIDQKLIVVHRNYSAVSAFKIAVFFKLRLVPYIEVL